MGKTSLRETAKRSRRKLFLEKGFELFSKKGIEPVTLQEVADECGLGIATLYRYFRTKSHFVVEIAVWKWEAFFKANQRRRPKGGFDEKTAAEMFDFYLESFLVLYRKNRDLMRFNQHMNIYIQSGEIRPDEADMYQRLMEQIITFFHAMYLKAQEDHTLCVDVPEGEILSTTIHLMLAAVTRYAVGLVYKPHSRFNAEKELITLKEMLYSRYTV